MRHMLFAAAVLSVVTAACGGGNGDHSKMDMDKSTGTTGAAAAPSRAVDVDMVDIAFVPKTLSVQRGERIQFVFHNKGQIPHDAFIGDTAAQADHEKAMHEGREGFMAGGHEMDETAITVDPGKTGSLTYIFDEPGTLEIGCHQVGHYAAGMKVAVTVA